MQTQNYGVNGSQVNELGQHLPPMQVYGKYEPHASQAASAARGLDEGRVKWLIAEFHKANGKAPKVYISPERFALTFSSFHAPGVGLCFLDIKHGQGPDRVE